MTNSPRECRGGLKRCEPNSFAEAVDCAAHHGARSIAEVAARIGCREGYLRQATSLNDDGHALRGDLIVPLTLATNNFSIINFIARSLGGVFFRLPEVEHPGDGELVDQTARAVGEFGDVLSDMRNGMIDGRVTIDEVEHFEKQGHEAIAEIARLMVLYRTRATDSKPTPEGSRR